MTLLGSSSRTSALVVSSVRRGVSVDWIERIFGVSPDGGSGSLEVVYFAVAVLGITALAFRRRIGRWARERRRREPR
jgi:hypothetical protein